MQLSTYAQNALRQQSRVMLLLWFAMCFSIGMIVVVGLQLPAPSSAAEIPKAVGIIPIILALLAVFARSFLFSPNSLQQKLGAAVTPESLVQRARGGAVNPRAIEELRKLNPNELKLMALPRWYIARMLVGLALAEMVAISALLLARGQAEYLISGGAAALLLASLYFPNFDNYLEKAKSNLPVAP
jgi:hypothetical protein